jgi:hypothetical protein
MIGPPAAGVTALAVTHMRFSRSTMKYDIGISYGKDMPEQLVLEMARELRGEDISVG